MISFMSSFEIINIVVPDPNIFLWRAPSVTDAAAVNPDGIKTLLGNGVTTCCIKGNLVFSYGPKSLPKDSLNCPILCIWVFDNFILAEKLFGKALWILETCVLVNNNLCRKLFSSSESPKSFTKILKVKVPFYHFNF